MRDALRPRIWKRGSDIIILSDVVAVVAFDDHDLKVYLVNGTHIHMSWRRADGKQIRDDAAKSLSDALEMYHTESVH